MSRSTANVKALTDKLMQRFETGDVSDLIQAALIQRQAGDASDVPCLNWSWSNRVIALMAGTSDARGYRQWQSVGRQVKAGSKALHILAPRTRKVTDEDDDGNETERVVMTGFAPCPVFRYEDTDGDALPEPADYTPDALPPLYGVARALQIDVRYHAAPSAPTWLGRYARRGSAESIHVITTDESTFLHELAHAAHRRVLKAKGAAWKGGQDAKQEAVAELSATVLAGMYGTDYSGNAWEYVSRYAKDGDPLRLMVSVLNDVCATCSLILDAEAAIPAPTVEHGRLHEAATVTMPANALPDVAGADSYTLQTDSTRALSLVVRQGSAVWREDIPGAEASTSDPVAVRLGAKQFALLRDILGAYGDNREATLALHTDLSALVVTVGNGSISLGGSKVEPVANVAPLPGAYIPAAITHEARA